MGESGDGVVAASSPWMAAQEPLQGKPESSCGAVLGDGFDGILAACGHIPARWREHWRYACAVEANGQDEQCGDELSHCFGDAVADGSEVAGSAVTMEAMRARAVRRRSSIFA